MSRIHIFLIKSFIGPFVVTFFTAIFILLMQFLWKYIDDLVGKGLDLLQIGELIFYASARFVPLALPIAILLTSVLVFGKLGENYELVAFKSAGIPFIRIIYPLFFVAFVISLLSYSFSNFIMPIANVKSASMMYDIQKKKPALNIKEGIFYNDLEGYSIKVSKKSTDGSTLEDIIIYDHTSNLGNDKVIVAESGIMQLTKDEKYLELILFNGNSYIDIPDKNQGQNPYRTTRFEKELIRFDLSSFSVMKNSEKLYKGHYAMLNNNQINKALDSLNIQYNRKINVFGKNYLSNYNYENNDTNYSHNKIEDKHYDLAINKLNRLKSRVTSNINDLRYKKIIIVKHKIEWHRKLSLAIACIIMFMIGAPLGAIIKKGGLGYPVLIAVLFFIIFHIISMIGEKSAKDLSMSALKGMWMANIILTPIAILLIYKASNDNRIFNLSESLSKILNYFKINR